MAISYDWDDISTGQGIEAPPDLEKYRLDTTIRRQRPKTRLKIGDVDAVYPGSITLIGGDRKQGKSQTLAIMTSVMLSGRPFGPLRPGEAATGLVLWIDTEQNDWFQSLTVKRLFTLMGKDEYTPSGDVGLHYLGTFGVDPEEQQRIIRYAVNAYRPSLLIIDQVGDLIADTNDNEQSAAVIRWLLDLTRERPDMAILTVLHNNPGSDKARGHIGSEMERKCSEKFVAKKNENGTFTVKCAFSRGKDPEPWDFEFDADGLLRPSGILLEQTTDLKDFKRYEDLTIDDLVPNVGDISYEDAITEAMKKVGVEGGKNTAPRNEAKQKVQQLFNKWEAAGLITKKEREHRVTRKT